MTTIDAAILRDCIRAIRAAEQEVGKYHIGGKRKIRQLRKRAEELRRAAMGEAPGCTQAYSRDYAVRVNNYRLRHGRVVIYIEGDSICCCRYSQQRYSNLSERCQVIGVYGGGADVEMIHDDISHALQHR